jgi:cytochrome c
MSGVPVPRDIPLPLPAPQAFLEVLLIVAFVAHILFVNLMVGGSLLTFALQLRGLRRPEFDRVAHVVASTVTVNKSIAVVLGVAPLLLINVLYTMHFYTANALTGIAWILLVPLISTAFLLLYLHKFTWDRLASMRAVHVSILGVVVALFLFIPLVFLANVNLMMQPAAWTQVHGFFDALLLPNVFPRYLHFLGASLVLTSLCAVWFIGRDHEEIADLNKSRLRRFFYGVAFVTSLVQFIAGPLVLFTLPQQALHAAMLLPILTGALAAIPAVWLMWRELTSPEPGKRLGWILALLSMTVLAMASGRHIARGVALKDHRAAMAAATEEWQYLSKQAAYEAERAAQDTNTSEGERLFVANCSGCHGMTTTVVGPPVAEIATIYKDNPEGIVTWAKAPGKKRASSPQMPPFASLGEQKLGVIARWLLEPHAEK